MKNEMDIDQQAKVYNQIEDVRQILERANEYGLEAEVVWSALLFAHQGNSISTSMEYALKEWDI